ncbi:hypothetical protein [Chryseobacterium sp.]|uniref:hypothetical protein n=1 Tax=Chryseobacterium sp. TaxID=1871047 RepID=UPI002FC9E41B
MSTITKQQISQLQTICSGKFRDREERLEALSDMVGTEISSVKDLNQLQAAELIHFFNTGKSLDHSFWGLFDIKNSQHKAVLSLCHSLGWVQEEKPEFVDLHRLGGFLKSDKCPVNAPLKEMSTAQCSKLIYVLQQIVQSKYK